MMRILYTLIALVGLLLTQSASAQLMQTNVGRGSAGGGVATPSFLLIQTGSIMLIQTGSKLEIHS